MTKCFSLFTIAAIAALLSSCAETAPTSSGTATVSKESLAAYQSFGWSKNRFLNLREQSRNTPQAKAGIDRSLESGFNAKGLTRTDAASADVLISYAVGSRSMHSSQTFTEDSELNQNQRQELTGDGRSGTLHTDYEQGRIYLTVTDRKSKNVVYRATSEATLLENPSERKTQSRLNKVVRQMLKNWPKR